jgi:hypothetical protein
VRLVERVAVDPELDADGAGAEKGLEYHGQCGFSSVHVGVEEADGGRDLPGGDELFAPRRDGTTSLAKYGANEHPAEIALVVERVQVSSHDISSIWHNIVVRPLDDGSRSGECRHSCQWPYVEALTR